MTNFGPRWQSQGVAVNNVWHAKPEIITIRSLQKNFCDRWCWGWLDFTMGCPMQRGRQSSFCFSCNIWILNCLGQSRTCENLLMSFTKSLILCKWIYRVGQKWVYSCMQNIEFIPVLAFINDVLFSIGTTLNLLLPHPVSQAYYSLL